MKTRGKMKLIFFFLLLLYWDKISGGYIHDSVIFRNKYRKCFGKNTETGGYIYIGVIKKIRVKGAEDRKLNEHCW